MKRLVLAFLAAIVGGLLVADALAAGAATKRVAIVHVQKGCHVWTAGAVKAPSVSVSVHTGSTLTVVNQDIDMHKLVQVAGPAVNAGPFLQTSQHVSLRFMKTGVYRFHTRVADMRGMPEVKTIGPDNQLVLTVRAS